MKTAVLLSGNARTFARCLASQHWHVYRKLENPHFYVSAANDADAKSMELLREKYPNAPVFIECVDQPALSEPPAILAAHAPYAISSPIQAILRQLWHLSKVWGFAMDNGAGDADVFIRARPDLHFHAFEMPERSTLLYDGRDDFKGSGATMMIYHGAHVPYWGGYGGVNDRFAVLGKDAANAYFKAWDTLPGMLNDGCPLHPESLISYALERGQITIRRTLRAEFSARRHPSAKYPDGELVHMVVLPQELAAYTAHLSKS